jgi:hypothetical protein
LDESRDGHQTCAHTSRANQTLALLSARADAATLLATTDGAPATNHNAISVSKIMQPNDDGGMNGQMGLAPKMMREIPTCVHQPGETDESVRLQPSEGDRY